jgi:hypothetical protein
MEPVPATTQRLNYRGSTGAEFWSWSKPWLFVGDELREWMDDAHRKAAPARPLPASRNSAAPARCRRTLRHGEFVHATARRRVRLDCSRDADPLLIKVVPRRRGRADAAGHLKRPDSIER